MTIARRSVRDSADYEEKDYQAVGQEGVTSWRIAVKPPLTSAFSDSLQANKLSGTLNQ